MCQFIMMIIKPDLLWQVLKPLPFSPAPKPPPVNDVHDHASNAVLCESRAVCAAGEQKAFRDTCRSPTTLLKPRALGDLHARGTGQRSALCLLGH